MFSRRRKFLTALRTLDVEIFAAKFTTRLFSLLTRSEVFKRSAVRAGYAERIFVSVARCLVGIFEQACRLIVKRGTKLVSQEVSEVATNAIYAVIGEVAIALENIGGGFYLREKIFQRRDSQRVVVFKAAIVGVENLRLREVKE